MTEESEVIDNLADTVNSKLSVLSIEDRKEFFTLIADKYCLNCGEDTDGADCWHCKEDWE